MEVSSHENFVFLIRTQDRATEQQTTRTLANCGLLETRQQALAGNREDKNIWQIPREAAQMDRA